MAEGLVALLDGRQVLCESLPGLAGGLELRLLEIRVPGQQNWVPQVLETVADGERGGLKALLPHVGLKLAEFVKVLQLVNLIIATGREGNR